MARIRTIKPDFWEDDTVGTLSRDARLLFVATWNVADDEGLLRWSPAYLKSVAFRYDWDITEAAVDEMMTELVTNAMVYPYRGGKAQDRLAWIVNFRKHQRINRPQRSRLPAPSLQNPAVTDIYLRRDERRCHLCSGSVVSGRQAATWPCLAPSLDHLIPVSTGGDDYPTNIRVSHVGCNKARGNRPVDIFRQPDSVRHALEQMGSAAPPLDSPAAPPSDDPVRTDTVNRSRTGSVNTSRNVARHSALPGSVKIQPSSVSTLVSDSLSDSRPDSLPSSVTEREREEEKEEEQPPAVTRATRPDARGADLETLTAQTITAAWVDRVRRNGTEPTRSLIGQAARTVKQLLDGRNDPERVLDAACRAAAKGFATIDRELLRSTADPDADRRDPISGRIVDWA